MTRKGSRNVSNGAESASPINAMPTKALFISMLTRDVGLIPAIIDLVDNAVDGARQLRDDRSYSDLWVRLELSGKSFRVSDNCAGISVETARDYAFRFGRDARAPSVTHSIGQFGVGMKRAVFKLGNHFRVESSTKSSRFVVSVDVRKWANEQPWQFEFSEIEEGVSIPADNRGTSIQVTALHPDIAEKLALESFQTELSIEIAHRLQDALSRGLAVSVNGVPVATRPLLMLADKRLAPATATLKFRLPKKKPVTVRLFCGLGTSDRAAAGWHVFCNARLVLEADKSNATGWGERARGIDIPGFHNQYNHLRGFAYFDSDDPGLLPWNTTKTGLDADSAIYRATRLEMIRLMRPVVTFLNHLKEEKQGGADEDSPGKLETLLLRSKVTTVDEVTTRAAFSVALAADVSRRPSTQRIQYDVPLQKAERARKALKVSTWKALGEKTFDYFYSNELGE